MASNPKPVGGAKPKFTSKSRLCRNIIIHGHCKFEDKGCEYNHNRETANNSSPSLPSGTPKLSVDSPEFQPLGNHGKQQRGTATTTVDASFETAVYGKPGVFPIEAAPGFHSSPMGAYPVSMLENTHVAGGGGVYHHHHPVAATSMGYDPYSFPPPPQAGYRGGVHMPYNHDFELQPTGFENMSISQNVPYGSNNPQKMIGKYHQNHQLDNHFFSNPDYRPNPYKALQHHLYSLPHPSISNLSPQQRSYHWFFVSEKLRQELLDRNEVVHRVLDPNSPEVQSLPSEVHVYHTLFPITHGNGDRVSKVFGLQSILYKAIRSLDGKPYLLWRIENYRLGNEMSITSIDAWTKLRHAGIVSVREGFTTKAFGDLSLVLVYDFHPLAVNLHEKYFLRPDPSNYNGIRAEILWTYICQLTSAIKAIHMSGLAVRVIEASKILLTGQNRVRINCCGIFDILMFDDRRSLQHHQQDDLIHFGQLILYLACGSQKAIHDLPRAIDHISKMYSADLKDIVLYLLSKPSQMKSIDHIVMAIAPRLLHESSSSLLEGDILEDELGRELENGRLVRLLCKLGHINERPEFELDPTWSETGDRYLLKLFRDYVFHQVSESGEPVVDLSHVISNLNKLDVGVDEKIMLMSRDEQSCLIVSYRELKQCVDSTFRELLRRNTRLLYKKA